MLRILNDKYFILCIATAFIILSSTFFVAADDPRSMIGMVSEVDESENGFVFVFDDSSGERVRCFTRDRPEKGAAYEISGDWSDDGTMVFVGSMKKLS